ncbi:hypothetical protein RB9460 [Rhodopirellula baltica SH 1]|uniref:Uncharacterized protein n=1 Tax=Rhodopirellula baltica (strain DSM 10527 / NCIMB 13988 / SH1) TaxID=243090 RepID=Q7ULJ8_RHOBA|nr:hypothetical protein RB9460 [Rhodopirellula baltica SH 1]
MAETKRETEGFFVTLSSVFQKTFLKKNGQLRLTRLLHFAILRDPPATARLTESPARRQMIFDNLVIELLLSSVSCEVVL